MFGLSHLGRRLVEGVVGMFAILGFLYVPLGRHTGLEHAKAILSTPAAAAALSDLTSTALGLRQRALDLVSGRLLAPSATNDRDAASPPQPKVQGPAPRPVPPKLK